MGRVEGGGFGMGFLIEKKKNNGANIFLFRRKAVPQFLLL